MKLGMTINISDVKNLLKEGLFGISYRDFRVLMTLDENEEFIKINDCI